MENGLSAAVIIGVGLSLAGLSPFLLGPFLKAPFPSCNRNECSTAKHVYRFCAGVLTMGMLVMAITFSVKSAVVTAMIPLILTALSFSLEMRHRKKRRTLIARDLPLFLDYLALQVGSGHSIQQALRSAGNLFSSDSPLRLGLQELEESMQVGSTTGQALEKFGRWLNSSEADAPISAISQAIQHGTPLGKVLREQSKRMREFLILEGEQFANTLSVKILIPLLFFIFPASFLVIFSPVIVSLSARLP